jgi:hypothetical protein
MEQVSPTLSAEEIYNITHYRRTAEQLRALARLGIPAERRHDNTVCVLRAHLITLTAKPAPARPQLKLA